MSIKELGYDLDAFADSEAMEEILASLRVAGRKGDYSKGFLYREIGDGSTQQSLMAATILRDRFGYKVDFGRMGIVVRW